MGSVGECVAFFFALLLPEIDAVDRWALAAHNAIEHVRLLLHSVIDYLEEDLIRLARRVDAKLAQLKDYTVSSNE